MMAKDSERAALMEAHRSGRHATPDPFWEKTCPLCIGRQIEKITGTFVMMDGSEIPFSLLFNMVGRWTVQRLTGQEHAAELSVVLDAMSEAVAE